MEVLLQAGFAADAEAGPKLLHFTQRRSYVW